MKIGTIDIDKFYIGGSEVDKVYLSTEIVYQKAQPDDRCIYFEATENSTVGLASKSTNQTFQYSTDKIQWNDLTTADTISVPSGSKLYLRGTLSGNNTSSDISHFTITGGVSAVGNINYLWNYENVTAPLKDFCGFMLFQGCLGLKNVSQLTLPAAALSDHCYWRMFKNCTNLTAGPTSLPATTLTNYCYNEFLCGTAITTAPSISATTAAQYSFYNMFNGCTSLTAAPSLNLTTLSSTYCCQNMFRDCTGLTNISNLTLGATTLTEGCYESMFYGCTSLTTMPYLNSTSLAVKCYQNMFHNCTSLTTLRSLPATTLATQCYYNMFYGCTSIKSTMALSATTLVQDCYRQMFYGCSNLRYIDCRATDVSASNCVANWVSGVYSKGVFRKSTSSVSWSTGNSGVPSNWLPVAGWIEMTANAVSTIGLSAKHSKQTLYYWKPVSNGYQWENLTTSSSISLSTNEKICVAGDLSDVASTSNTQFSITGNVKLSGNIKYLFTSATSNGTFKNYCGYRLFRECTGLTDASGFTIPTAAQYSAAYMFYGCTNLEKGPVLEKTSYNSNQSHCYDYMFSGCSKLKWVKCLATFFSSSYSFTSSWMTNVARGGTFVKAASMTSWARSDSGIPTSWTVQDA